MITIKSSREIELMRQAGRITAGARTAGRLALRAGMTTGELDKIIEKYIRSQGALPTFKGYGGFPGAACISINDEVIHGIPGKRKIQNGDIVSIDVGATYKGYVGDCCGTFAVGEIPAETQQLIDVTRQSFFEGIKMARAGNRLSDISHAVQVYAESFGYGVVREYVGHGVGTELHEAPEVPNFGAPGHGPRLVAGMTIAVEPMITAGRYDVRVLSNDWTVVTKDHSLSAHYENTILITDGDPEILTMADDI